MPKPQMTKSCFLAGTVVETQDGLRAIETVEVGQWVAGRNEASGQTTWRRVVQTFRTEDMEALAVSVRHADGELEIIQTTTEHPFYVQNKKWLEARELRAGDQLVLIDNARSTVVAVEPIVGLHVVYNFEVEVDHTYFVGYRGVWVHNTCNIGQTNVARLDSGKIETPIANAPSLPAKPIHANPTAGTSGPQTVVASPASENFLLLNKTHKGSLPKPKGDGPNGGALQSHHGLQQQWAKENLGKYGYDPELAPAITIETGRGFPHTTISNLQNARRDARVASGKGKWETSLQDELKNTKADLTAAGFNKSAVASVMEQQYKMLEKLNVPYRRLN